MTDDQPVGSLVLSQFSESNDLIDFIDALIVGFPELEQTFDDLKTKRSIFTSEGVQLDRLGELLNEPRRGRNDQSYRDALFFKVFINTSNPTPNTLITITKTLTSADLVYYWELYPASYQIFSDGPDMFTYSTSTVNEFLYSFPDNELWGLDDGSILELRRGFVNSTLFPDFLRRLSPVAIGEILVSYSLGNTAFSFAGSALKANFVLNDGSLLELSDGSRLGLILNEFEGTPANDNSEGYAGIIPSRVQVIDTDEELYDLALDDGTVLGVVSSTSYNLTEEGGKLVGGMNSI